MLLLPVTFSAVVVVCPHAARSSASLLLLLLPPGPANASSARRRPMARDEEVAGPADAFISIRRNAVPRSRPASLFLDALSRDSSSRRGAKRGVVVTALNWLIENLGLPRKGEESSSAPDIGRWSSWRPSAGAVLPNETASELASRERASMLISEPRICGFVTCPGATFVYFPAFSSCYPSCFFALLVFPFKWRCNLSVRSGGECEPFCFDFRKGAPLNPTEGSR